MSIGIYKITSPKGKIYIGQSVNIELRLKKYKNSGAIQQPKLNHSFNKYGFSSHVVEIIEICRESDLNDRECFYIKKFDTFQTDIGMNCRSGGSFGRHSEYSNELNRQAHLGRKHKPETLKRYRELSDKKKGVKRDPEIGNKISAKKIGVKFSDMHKENLKASFARSDKRKEAFKNSSIRKSKKVINTETGIIYPSAKEAAESEGMRQYTLTPKLNGTYKNNTTLRYL